MRQALLILLLLPAVTFAQNKKDTKIIVTVADTANLFNRIAKMFYQRGYSLTQKDEVNGFLATDGKEVQYLGLSRYRALIQDSTVTLTGEIAFNSYSNKVISGTDVNNEYSPVSFSGMKGSLIRKSWDEMQEIAKLIGEKITYAK
jgi:hypothetical protein